MQIRQPVVSRVQIGEEAAGQRLDNYLFKRLKGVPKSRVYRMLREGELRVNGRRAQPDHRLELGDELRIPPVRTAVKPESENLPKIGKSLLGRVIYRDDSLLVLDKPAGQAVHGGSGISLGIIEQMRRELPEQRFMELAHRLDRETSGVLLIALKRSALTELHRMLRDGEVKKTYLALAVGQWRDPVRHVKLPLHKFHTDEGERRVMVREDGQHAHTIFRLQRKFADFSLLEAELKTGRTHQIRVHHVGVMDTEFYIRKHIFPGGWIPSLAQTIQAMEAFGLEVVDIENLRRHYAPTLDAWATRFDERWEQIHALDPHKFDEAFRRKWRSYLWSCAEMFRSPRGQTHLFQIVFSKGNISRDNYPMSRGFLYP